MGKRDPLCEVCAKAEMDQAFACRDRERAAMARGEDYVCTCPIIRCGHDLALMAGQHKSEGT